jgi:hypothetical protein
MLVSILGKKRNFRGEIAVSNPRMRVEVTSDASELPLLHSSRLTENLTGARQNSQPPNENFPSCKT